MGRQRLQARDETAFREIVENYASKVYRISYGILGNRNDADEIAQEVFAKIYFSSRGFEGGSRYAWISRITVDECYGFLHKKPFTAVNSSDEAPPPGREAIQHRPDRAAMLGNFIHKLLARMPIDDRWLLISKEFDRVSIGELSQMTGLNGNAIKR